MEIFGIIRSEKKELFLVQRNWQSASNKWQPKGHVVCIHLTLRTFCQGKDVLFPHEKYSLERGERR